MWLTERNAALSARAIHKKPACRHPNNCARGRGQRLKETYRRSCPEGTWLKFSAWRGDRGRQGN